MNKTTFTKPDMVADELVMPSIKVTRLSVSEMLKFDHHTQNKIHDAMARMQGRPMKDINPPPMSHA